ncbi:hypothetical protein PI87_02585 [Ralstonia sp. A12]|uniref:carbohydrate-binding protein n=1 Tax=Ralstonia sp. A12 TaxID=1217052 RepID=UPI000574E2E8|nr:carbohydrate-binding protein [Ralstonia sp. A12]KHK58654.1 hypothetical protein PI87_02585 [Ralstonia sp. A12]
MVGIISGDFFGLTGNSLAGLGQRGLLGTAGEGSASQQAYVNVATGNLVLQGQDDFLASRGVGIGVVRTYNSLGTYNNENSDAWWRNGYHRLINQTGTVNQPGSSIQRVAADGSILTYTYDTASQHYLAATGSGQFDSLSYDAGSNQWTWTQSSTQNTETYTANGNQWRMTSASDLNGNTTTYAYTGDLLTNITDASGESVRFTYQGNNLSQEEVVKADGTLYSRTSYRYDYQNRLQQVKVDLSPSDDSISDGNVYVTSYSYVDNTNLISSVTQTDGSQLSFTYTTVNGRSEVASVTDSLGRTVSFTYDPADNKTTVTDPYGNQNVYTYDANHRLTEITGPQVSGVTQQVQYTYDSAGNLVQSTDAEGNQVQSTFDTNGNLLTQADSLGNRVEKSYDAKNRLIASTLYQQPATVGQAAAEPLTTRYVYDSNENLRFAISPEGRVVEYRYDAYGERTSQIGYPAQTYDVSALSVGQAPTLQGMTNWAAAQNATQTTRTDYQYNTRGQVVGTVTYSRVDATGAGVSDGTQSVQTFSYDAAGNLLFSVDANGNQTSYTYDGLNRLLSSTDAAGNITVNQYDDADHVVRHTLANGRVDTSIYDTAGQLVSTIQGGQAQSEYRYDALGRLVLSIDPTGVEQHYFYDAAGRLQAQVDGTGQVTAFVYNDLGQKVQTVRYATLLSASQMAALDAGLNTASTAVPAAPAQNIPQWSAAGIYTQGSQVVYGGKVYQANWYVQGIEPDSANSGAWSEVALPNTLRTWSTTAVYQSGEKVAYAGQVFQAQWYVQGVDPEHSAAWAQVSAPGTYPSWNAGAAYQAGTVVSYDGKLWQNQWYSQGGTPDSGLPWQNVGLAPALALPSLSLPERSSGDQINVTLYDAAGRVTWQVDGEGYVVHTEYDGASRVTSVTQMATRLDTSVLGDPAAVAQALSGQTTAVSLNDAVAGVGANASHLLTATVTGSGQPGGTVDFYAGETLLGTGTLNASGVATLSVAALPAGAGTLRAVYSGDATNLGSASDDRTVNRLYDKDGLLRATIDGEGFLTEFRYNAAGQRIQSIAYAEPVTSNAAIATASSTDSLASLLPVSGAADIQDFYYYDGHGRLVGHVDGEGYLTESVYDADGNLTQTIRYANRANGPVGANSTLDALRPTRSVEDHVSLNTWDALNRLKSQTNAEGSVSQFSYDSVGDVVASVTAAGTADQRTALVRYDSLGRVTEQLSARGAALITGNETPTQLDAIWAQYATQYSYDAAGRRISATDPNGNRSLFYYDQDGRLRYTVNAEGEVQERQYDAFGNLTSTMAYGARVDAGTLANLQGGVLTEDTHSQQAEQAFATAKQNGAGLNSTTQYTYNGVNELVSTTDANGGVTTASYDTFGDVVSSTQSIDGSSSVTTTRSYDRRGLQTEVVSDVGGANIVTRAQYDAFGRLIESVDGNGHVSSQTFDRLGRVVQALDPTNAQRSSSYDAFGRVLTQTDALGDTTQYSYSTANRSMTVTTPEGVSVTTVHNAEGQAHSVTDGNGNTTVYSYDADGNLVGTTSPTGQSTSQYDHAGRLIETIDANGNKVDYTYDAANRLLSRTVDPNGLNLVTRYQYDAKGERISTTDANGTVTLTAYDLKGQVASQTVDPNGLNLTTTYTYDDVGHVLTVTDPKGITTQYVYDALGRRVETHVDPQGLDIARLYAYDANGNVVNATDGNGNTTRYVYDADNRLVYTIDAAGDVQQNTYDAQGQLTNTTAYVNCISLAGLSNAPSLADVASRISANSAQDSSQSRVYDNDGRLNYTVDGTGSVVRYSYDANGNVVDRVAYANAIPTGTQATEAALGAAVTTIADASRDVHVRNIYDAGNRLIWSADGTGAVIQRSYDANGNLVKQVAYANRIASGASADSVAASADDRVTLMAYDSANRLTWQVDAMGGVTHLVYDANGNVAERISYANRVASPGAGAVLTAASIASAVTSDSANDRTARAVFDAANRQIFSVDSTGAVVETRYDADGNAVQTTAYANRIDSGVLPQVALLSDMQSRLQPNAANDRTTRHVFDTAGRPVYAIDALGNVQQTEYDGAGRVASTTLYANAIPLNTLATEANVSAAIRANATVDQTNVFSYDAAGHLTSSTDPLGNTETYTWNGVGDKLSYTNKKGDTWTYAYDAAGRMVSETSPAVPLVTVGVGASGKLAISQAGSAPVITRLAYDALGNLISRTEAAGRPEERTTQYRYDALGRQIQTIYPTVGVYNAAADDLASNGADGVAARTDAVRQLSTSVIYDAFGDAVSNVDVAGNVSYKTYDALGRVSYDVDAVGYVTGYGRNTFGDVTALTRYAGGTALETAGALALSTEQVSLAVADLDHSNDRTIVTQYDQLGRAIQVTQPPTWVSNGPSYMASAVTRNTYNAFGQLLQSAALADPTTNTWATTTHYFDQDGRETATVDALGYVTTQAYDAAGNVVRRTEFANATSNWSIGSLTMPAVSNDDRITATTYDQNNRKTSETRVNVEYSPSDNGISTRGDLTTSYGYDAVGNLTRTTDAKGHSTYTYYDAMGRTVAVVAPVRANTDDGLPLTPLSVFYRDALGNAVVRIDFARGAASASESGYVPGAASGDDHVTFNQYDSHGNLTQTTDAGGNNHYYSYDAFGHLAKQWMGVTGNDGVTHTLFSAFQYDALGRQTDIITPASTSVVADGTIETISQQAAGVIHTRMAYNGFGEMILRGTGSGDISGVDGVMHIESAVATGGKVGGDDFAWQEHFDYDAAGHLWRTNSGDGVEKVFLYNLQGYQTAQITSKGQVNGASDLGVDLTGFSSARDVELFGFETTLERRTDSTRDLLGRVTQETLPARFAQNVGSVRPVVYQTYDRWGNVASQSDVRNAAWITTFRYNANNQVIEETQPDGNGAITQDSPVTRLFYDALGQQVGVLDANGHFNGKVWDAGGNLVEEDHADGGTVQYDYDAFGNRTVAVDAMGNTTRYAYDSLGRNTAVINDVVNQYTVDGNNNVTGVQSNDVVSMTYDQAGRKLSTTNGNGETTRFTYDLRGNVVATTQPMGEVSRAAFDALGHQIGALDANGALATWGYDVFGQLKAHTDIGGAVYSFQYDNARQLITQSNNHNQLLYYQYDSAGQLVQITDAGTGHITQYDYNLAGKHVHERTFLNTGAATYQDQTLAYDTLGRLAQVNTADGTVSLHFEYDKVGNRVLQQTSHTTYTTTTDYEYVVTGYDEAGSPQYAYMPVQHSVPTTTTQNLWYAYDSMNRQILVDGAVNNNATDIANVVGGQGHILTYDKNGNRTSDMSWGEQVVRQENIIGYDESGHAVSNGVNYVNHAGRITEYYTYDRMNRLSTVSTGAFDQNWQALSIRESILLDTRKYDGASRVVESGPAGHLSNAYIQALTNGKSDANGAVTRVSHYDADGHLLSLHTTKPDGSFSSDQVYEKVNTWQTQEQVQTGTDESGAPIYITQTVTHTSTSSGYDAAGNVTNYRITDSSGVTETFSTTYTKFEGYKEASVTGFRSDNAGQSGTTLDHYDVNGNLIEVEDTTKDANSRVFVNDANGNILQKTQQGNVLQQLVVDGQVYGTYGTGVDPTKPTNDNGDPNYADLTNFNLSYQPITNAYPGAATGQYTIRSGDTLRSIAQSAYGDAELWYQIADANDLRSDNDLRVGQTLTIPNRVASAHNTSSSFKPYDPGKVVGDTTPNLPVPQQDSGDGGGCGVIGQIVMIVVAVVATIYTAGAAAGAFAAAETGAEAGAVAATEAGVEAGAEAGTLGATEGVAADAAATSIGGTFSAGLSVVQGGYGIAGLGYAAIGGAVGSIASQAVGNLIGAQHGFSWDQVALSAIGSGVSAGMGSVFGTGGGLATGIGRAAAGSVVTQGIEVAVGLQHSFSWRQVAMAAASSAVGSVAGSAANTAMGYNPQQAFDFSKSLISGAVSSLASGTAMAVMRGGKVQIEQVAVDAFGNALGQSLAENAGSQSNSQQEGVLDQAIEQQVPPAWNGGPQTAQGGQVTPGQAVFIYGRDSNEEVPIPAAHEGDADRVVQFTNQLMNNGAFTYVPGPEYAPIATLAANDVKEPGQPVVTSDAGGGGANELAPVVITGSNSMLYRDGRGAAISEQSLADGTVVKTYANGYSVTDPQTGKITFTPADMSGLGATLSGNDYNFVSKRAAELDSNYDSPGAWHDFKVGLDNLLGITPNPVRSIDQEAELAALQGIARTRVDAISNPSKYDPTLAAVDTAAGGLVGAAAVIATQNSDPERRQDVLTLARAADGTLFAFGSAGAAKVGMPSALEYQGAQDKLKPEWGGPVDYSKLEDPASVGQGKNFTQAQKQNIYIQNIQANGGVLRSDLDGEILVLPSKSQSGVTPPTNEAQVDHVVPRRPSDPMVSPGSNSYSNAAVLSRAQNRDKSND